MTRCSDYENEAIAAKKKGAEVDYVIPKDTILIQAPVAAVGSSNAAQGIRRIPALASRPGDLGV